jgi:hypothetical protein
MCLARILTLALAATIGSQATAQDKLFSGPQPGEKLANFKVRGFFEPNAGEELDFVQQAGKKPIVLVFIHDANRQSLRFTQVLGTLQRSKPSSSKTKLRARTLDV